MPRQPSPSRSTVEPHGTEVHVPTDSLLAVRRPSWTPSISALPEHEDRRTPNSLSQSKRRSKIHDENPTPGLLVDWVGTPSSLSRARRPSFEPSTTEPPQRARKPRPEAEQSDAVVPPDILSSPEEGKGFRSSWEINVKKLVGDAVGNMSISPASRDIVLAARRGLFIIDLESRFSIPRFLPQGGTWDVADVQWNPHPSHAQYIVSTSSEKLLIWNLCLAGKTSIQHILRSHYRAITDINWHTTECDIVVSTGIDSWLWAWDLRAPRKPIFGLSAFQSGGTQVKWNYQDGNLLASSHSNEVLIWDRRKGSLPVTKIRAHMSKIYGIDWSRRCSNEIVTCSLDKTIKTWDINSTNSQANPEPKTCIQTTYPVWRARNLPFGEGILSLPQRGETTLEMYGKSEDCIETFEGHSDVVKEFVWRRGNNGDFQLITWSKDRTLRFWPIDAEVMHKVGHEPEIVRGRSKLTRSELETIDTFRDPPEVQEHFPVFSAPIGPRAILAEVRALQPPKTVLTGNYGLGPTSSPTLPKTDDDNRDTTPTLTNASLKPIVMPTGKSTGPTMSKGSAGLKSIGQLDQLAWLASVKVGSKRGSNSSGAGSGVPSRLSSRSRPPSGPERSGSDIGARQRSGSLNRAVGDERKDGDLGQSLQDEITSVLTKLAASKIKLEKHDLTKKRTCTLGLHGPWGEKSSVFMRITFTFPREYPHAGHPHGTPFVELERNPLILMRDRAFILKHLRRIRERKRPCLEPCLRFLLFADEGVNDRDSMDSGSSDEDDDNDNGGDGKKSREITVSLLRNHKNLAEPRSSQGSFGPNGELVSFFRAPPRIVRNVLRGLTNPSSMNSESTEPFQPPEEKQQEQEQQQQPTPPKASYLRSPALVSDAVRRLGLAATDRTVPPIDPKRPETSSNILRAMTNLLTVPQPKARRDSETKHSNDDVSKNYSVFPTRRSIVFMTSTNNIAGADKKVAGDYVFTVSSGSLADVCEVNAVAARNRGRYDHERVFRTLKMLFRERDHPDNKNKCSFTSNALAAQVITGMYSDYVKEKDVQMLAMLSVVALQTEPEIVLAPSKNSVKNLSPITAVPPKMASMDYFSLTRSAVNLISPTSSEWSHLPSSPVAPSMTPSFSSSNSSRGSWSSLFNTGSVRQFMNGVQDSLKEGLSTPTETVASHGISTISARSTEKLGRTGLELTVGGPHKRRIRQESLLHARAPMPIPKAWNDGVRHSPKLLSPSFSSGRRQHLLRFADSNTLINENQAVIFRSDDHEDTVKPLFDPQLVEQFKLNIYVYAELLFRWQLFHKRLELLKAVGPQQDGMIPNTEPHRIGMLRLCPRNDCKATLTEGSNICRHCSTSCPMPRCTICRFPVKGLSRTCLSCSHVTHISCWNSLDVTVPICPSGCGCFCTGTDGPFTRPSTRLGLTPPFPSMFALPAEL